MTLPIWGSFFKCRPKRNKSNVRNAVTGKSLCKINESTFIGQIIEETPITIKELKILDPTILPNARAVSPFLAAITEEASSGKDVPIATTVKPINKSLTPKAFAISVAPKTSNLELPTRSPNPKTSQNKDDKIFFEAVSFSGFSVLFKRPRQICKPIITAKGEMLLK